VEHSETHQLMRQEAILMGFVSLNPSYPLRRLASARPRERTAFFRLCGANRSGIIMLTDSHCMLFPIWFGLQRRLAAGTRSWNFRFQSKGEILL